MSDPIQSAYAAPRAPAEEPSGSGDATEAAPRLAVVAARIAGAYMAADALTRCIGWVLRNTIWSVDDDRRRHIPWALRVFPALLPLLVELALAIPLLLGSLRLRRATIIVTSIGTVLSLATMIVVISRVRPETSMTVAIALTALHWMIVMLLIGGRVSRLRIGLALVGVAVQVADWVASALR